MSQETVTIANEIKLAGGLAIAIWAIVTQQIFAALIYASLNAFTKAGRIQYIGGYVQEYLLWRLRLPMHALSWGEKVANLAALSVVLLLILLSWRWLA